MSMQPIILQAPYGTPMLPGAAPFIQAAVPINPVPNQPVSSAFNNQVGVQRYMPLSSTKRPFTEAENAEIKQGQDQWIPTIASNYSTPIPQLLSSPTKGAIMDGAIIGGMFALLTRFLVSGSTNKGIKVLIAGLLGGGIGAFTGYIHRKQRNGNVLDLMQRLPEGATKRDMLSDPVYQADLNRRAQMSGSYGSSNAVMTGMLAGSMMSAPYSCRSNYRTSSNRSSGSSKSK